MAQCSTNDFRTGLKILYNSAPHTIVENEFVKPGKGQAFNRVKLRNLLTGKLFDKTFRSNEQFEIAEIIENEMQYLYNDGELFHFMDQGSFEQVAVPKELMETAKPWILGEEICQVVLWNNQPIQVIPPIFVDLKVVETDPGLKGDTVSGGGKPATLQTGVVVRVPLFVREGETVRIDTRDGSYLSRSATS